MFQRERLAVLALLLTCAVVSAAAPAPEKINVKCDVCILAMDALESALKSNASYSEIEAVGVTICSKLNIWDDAVCKGTVKAFVPVIVDVVLYYKLQPRKLCSYLKLCNKTSSGVEFSFDSSPVQSKPAPAATDSYYVLHITDVHLDLLYKQNTTVDCGRPLCCREGQTKGSIKAGKWGSHNCDMPLHTVENMFQFASQKMPNSDRLAYVMYTGDDTPHDIWVQTQQSQLDAGQALWKLFDKYFAKTPVYAAFGNHDTFPESQYSNVRPQFQVFRDHFAKSWARSLTPEAVKTVRRYGYYQLLVTPGLRLVALNTQRADLFNFYNLFEGFSDQINQTTFLRDTLDYARAHNERVVIIGHIPAGVPENVPVYGSWYAPIVMEYADVISGQFYGHTHDEQVHIQYHGQPGQDPASVVWVSPGATSYGSVISKFNPSVRVYKFDKKTHAVINYFTYTLNITDANLTDNPKWLMTYDPLKEYGMTDLSAASWDAVVKRMPNEPELVKKILMHRYTGYPPPDMVPCVGKCVHALMCRMTGATTLLYDACMEKVSENIFNIKGL